MVDTLSVICEFSIGLAGFTGVLAIFSGEEISISPVIRFRVRNLLLCAFVPGFLGLGVLGLLEFGYTHLDAARFGSAIFLVFLITWGFASANTSRRFSKGARQELNNSIFAFSCICILINLGLQTYGFFSIKGAATFVAGLILLLFQGAVFFGALIFQLLDERTRVSHAEDET